MTANINKNIDDIIDSLNLKHIYIKALKFRTAKIYDSLYAYNVMKELSNTNNKNWRIINMYGLATLLSFLVFSLGVVYTFYSLMLDVVSVSSLLNGVLAIIAGGVLLIYGIIQIRNKKMK